MFPTPPRCLKMGKQRVALFFFRAESVSVTYGQMARDRQLDHEEDVDGIGGGGRGVLRVGRYGKGGRLYVDVPHYWRHGGDLQMGGGGSSAHQAIPRSLTAKRRRTVRSL